jgi:hypothetical protein
MELGLCIFALESTSEVWQSRGLQVSSAMKGPHAELVEITGMPTEDGESSLALGHGGRWRWAAVSTGLGSQPNRKT